MGAPKVHLVQEEGEDLCVSNSIASAIFELGFVEEAAKIAAHGREKLARGTVNALKKVMIFALEVRPKSIGDRELYVSVFECLGA
jgi:hypothetical protein